VCICDDCAEELKQEARDSGAEHPMYGKNREDYFSDQVTPGGVWGYLFPHEGRWVVREDAGWFDMFPYRDSRSCARCGVSEGDLWRERFGSVGDE
jgi:hypothetical protein